MSNKIKQAEALARFVHMGQKRQDGEDYIHHCERIIHNIKKGWFNEIPEEKQLEWLTQPFTQQQENIICVAWLHDCIEDGKDSIKLLELIEIYFGSEVRRLVFRLSHLGGKYNEYIEEVSKNPEALQIKWLDMIDNTSYHIPEKQRKKYREACIHLGTKGVEIPKILQERLKL